MLGGALAGLAAGGLLASLFGGGAFSGMQGFDFLILGLLAFGAFFLFRKFKRQGHQQAGHSHGYQNQSTESPLASLSDTLMHKKSAVEGHHGSDAQFLEESKTSAEPLVAAPVSNGIIGGDDVPENLPGGFDREGFLKGAREHYVILQNAWNKNDQSVMREYMAPELFEQLNLERSKLSGDQHTEVLFVDAGIVRADYTSRVAQISVKYTGRYKDQVEGVEEDINDIWHLERDITHANAPWLIVGME